MADIVMADLVLANIVMAVAAEPRQAEVGGVHVRSPCVETCVSACVYEGEQVCRGGCVAIAAWIDLCRDMHMAVCGGMYSRVYRQGLDMRMSVCARMSSRLCPGVSAP